MTGEEEHDNPYASDDGGAAAAIKAAMDEIGFEADQDGESVDDTLAAPMGPVAESDVVADDGRKTAEDEEAAEDQEPETSAEPEEPEEPEEPQEADKPEKAKDEPEPAYLDGLSEEDAKALAGAGDRAESMAERLKLADEMQTTLAPFKGTFEKAGLSLTQGVLGLARINHFANTDPTGYVMWYGQQVGWSKDRQAAVAAALGDAKPKPDQYDPFADDDEDEEAEAPEPPPAPAFNPAQPTQQETASMLDQWMSAKDPEGKPLRPHIDTVGESMAISLRATASQGVAITPQLLDTLYEQAVWGDTSLRSQLLAERDAKALKEKEAASKAVGAKARKATKTLRAGSQGGRAKSNSAPDPNDDLRGFIAQGLEGMDL